MTTIADVKALPEVDAEKLAIGDSIIFRGVSNVLLQVVEGQKHFAIGQVYKVTGVHQLLGLGHIIKVDGVDGFHFANLFANVPADFTGVTPEETADVPLDAVKEVVAQVEQTEVAQKVKAVVPEVVQAAKDVAAAAPAVADAAVKVAEAAPAIVEAKSDPVAAVEAVAEVAPAVAEVTAAVADATTKVAADVKAAVDTAKK